MKKIFAILICLLALTFLFACDDLASDGAPTANDNNNNDNNDNGDVTQSDYSVVESEKYYKIEESNTLVGLHNYYIYDSEGNTVLSEQTERPLRISMVGESVVDVCVGMGTGISVHKYYDVTADRFSEEYSYVVAVTEELVAYIEVETIFERALIVRDIFDSNEFYKAYMPDFSPTMTSPVEKASFAEDESVLHIRYYTERPPISVEQTLPVRSSGENGQSFLVYWSNDDGTCRVSAIGLSADRVVVPPTSPFGDKVTALASMAFYGCEDLEHLTLPETIEQIGRYAFDGCSSLNDIVYGGAIYEWAPMVRAQYGNKYPAKCLETEGKSEQEIEKLAFEAFLKNEIMSDAGCYLKDCREDYLMDYLWEKSIAVDYAYVDMDGDGQVELLVRGIDTFVFSYYHSKNVISIGSVYSFREMNRIYVDGSYSWNYPSSNGPTYGHAKNGKDIWRIENDGGEYPLYYIGDKTVTKEEMLKYLEENPNPQEVKFTSISGEGWNKVIGIERAEEIASEYWNIKDGDINQQTGKKYRIYVSGMQGEKYEARLYSEYSNIDCIWIDAVTGKISTDTGAKG